jgi:hypothetical protein
MRSLVIGLAVISVYLGCDIAGNTDFSTIDGLAIGKLGRGSSLETAGLKAGDRILRIDNTRILNRRHFRDLQYALWGGKKISVTYVNSSGQQKTVEATTGSRLHEQWLGDGQHGLELGASRDGQGVVVKSVAFGSPSEKAGCEEGDTVVKVNGVSVAELRLNGAQLLVDVMSGVRCHLTVSRDGKTVDLDWTANRPNDSAWFAGKPEKRGGWVYYKNVRGGTTFMTSDLLRTLVRAHSSDMPLDIPPQMIAGAFSVISKLRKKQPNSDVESYRYDAGGSFWNVQDIRGDVGRLNAAELACVMYCDAGFPHDGDMKRTQANVTATLREWLKHRGIMDYQKVGLHGKFSIAPYYFPYSHLTTLEAADYFGEDDALKLEVQKIALKAYMKYVRIEFFKSLGRDSWLIGYYPRPQLLRTCLQLDGLSLVKRLYRPQIEIQHAELRDAFAKFNLRQYGEAYQLLQAVVDAKSSNADLVAEAKKLQGVIDARFAQRLEEIKEIHKTYYRDAIGYLQETKPHFVGFPPASEIDDLLKKWELDIVAKGAEISDSLKPSGGDAND